MQRRLHLLSEEWQVLSSCGWAILTVGDGLLGDSGGRRWHRKYACLHVALRVRSARVVGMVLQLLSSVSGLRGVWEAAIIVDASTGSCICKEVALRAALSVHTLDGYAVVAGVADIPSSVVGLWGVYNVAPALFTCVNVCVREAVARQRSNVLHEFYGRGQLGDRWLSSAWLRFTRDVGIASTCRGVKDADSRFLTDWDFFEVSPGGIRSDGQKKKDLFSPTSTLDAVVAVCFLPFTTPRGERAAHAVDSSVERVLSELGGYAVVAGLADVGSGGWRRGSEPWRDPFGRSTVLAAATLWGWRRGGLTGGNRRGDFRAFQVAEDVSRRMGVLGLANRWRRRQRGTSFWMGTQWWRDWLTWGLGGGEEIPSSFVGPWGVWRVGPALSACVNVCVREAVALQRSNVLHEFYRL
ncbi:uncharacterized protein EMH_0022540 [Eimeria mitis]|uniref:Uncharacterized protein n=1 Tax=Eimeria mitis TaxID=44415 RepID=U6KA38_9EIME|nr:uncharacterized protein EMH_0022540 [Eimeria mitis]CDJ34870.1 hypothetical protein EMH_0022540 [Eimeria mitis]